MSFESPFPCTKCGLCCRTIGNTVTMAREAAAQAPEPLDPQIQEALDFPFGFTAAGACEKLVDDQCSVYDSRPDICSIERTWKKHHPDMPKENYYALALVGCSILQKQAEKIL